MYYAWKDDNFLLKILASIILFIFLSMILISPVFAGHEISFTGVDDNEYTINLKDDLSNAKYFGVFLFESSSYQILSYVCSDVEFYWTKNGMICNYNTEVPIYGYTSSMFPNHTSYDNILNKFNNLTFDDLKSSDFNSEFGNFRSGTAYSSPGSSLIFSNFDVRKDENGEIIHPSDVVNLPHFLTTKTEMESGKFQVLKIDSGDMDYDSDSYILNIYDNYSIGEGIYNDYIQKSILLDRDSKYRVVSDLNIYYYIPQENLGIDLTNGKRYTFDLTSRGADKEVYDSVTFEVGGLTEEEEQHNKDDEQTDAIKENTETNKRYMGNNKRYTRLYKPI